MRPLFALLGSAYVSAVLSIGLVLGLSAPARAQATCGNGIVEPGETCDDGNIVSGDGCSSTCQVEPGSACVGTSPSVCGVDTDRDGIPDKIDNCPFQPNGPLLGTCLGQSVSFGTTCHANAECGAGGVCSLNQEDSGGVNTTTPDRIGDVCQCGDVTNDGVVNDADYTILSRSLVALSPYYSVEAMPGFNKCQVTNGGLCDSSDKTVMSRALAGLSPGIKQSCPPAIHWSPIGGGLGNGQPTQCVSTTQPTIPDLNAEGWLGGDGGASFLMPDQSSIWLFGDSYIGPTAGPDRTGLGTNTNFVSNSIGISACGSQMWGAMDHYWGQIGMTPLAFLNPYLSPSFLKATGFDWPLQGFSYGSNIYVTLQRGVRTPGVGLGFKLTGTDLAIISNSDPANSWTNPAEWTQQIVPINTSGFDYPNSAIVVGGDGYVYIYTSVGALPATSAGTPMTLVRAQLNDLSNIANDLRYRSQDGTWKTLGADNTWENDALIVMYSGGMSVSWHPAQSEWIAVYNLPFSSNQIWMSTATSQQGAQAAQDSLTWSPPQAIYPIPEVTLGSGPTYDPNNVCYAALEHIEWATPNSMVVTYVCSNSNNYLSNMNIYHPVPVLIQLPQR